jgi:hypothetical protein
MTQLATDQQLTLQAFQAAVDTYKQRGIALPEAIATIANTLAPNIDRLDILAEIDPAFDMAYQSARSALQNQSSQRAKFLDTSAPPNRSAQNGFHTVEIKPDSNGHSPSPGSPESNGHNKTGPPPVIKRFVLPLGFSAADREHFDRYIQRLRQLNPQWVVSPDHRRPGEADAYVMLHNDENYATNHAVYLVDQVLNQAFT